MLNPLKELLKIYLEEKYGPDSPDLKEAIEFYKKTINEYKDEILWGASARFTVEFLRTISA